MVRSVSLLVLCIFAKRFILSVSGVSDSARCSLAEFLTQQHSCCSLVGCTLGGAVSWIVLLFSCRADIPRELGQAQFGGQILITLRISASALKDFRLVWRGESEYCSGGSIDVRLEQLALTNVPLLLVFVLIYRWGWRMLWTLCL